MKIVSHCTQIRSVRGGVPRSTLEIARLMGRGGHGVTVMTAAGGELPDEWCGDGGPRPQVLWLGPLRGRLGLLSRACRGRVATELAAADVLLVHGMWSPRNSQVAALARRAGVPYVMLPHGTLDHWSMRQHALRKRLYYRLLERRNLAGAAIVLTTAEAERDQAGRWIPHRRIEVAPLPLNPTLTRLAGQVAASAPRRGEAPRVLFLSRLHPKKGVEVLLAAMGLLRQSGVDCRLDVAGTGAPGYLGELERLAERYGIADRTRFLGWVDGREKIALYQQADLFALPTRQENFGRVLFESLACRTPVVTTRDAALADRILSAGGGLLAERTPAAFADAVAELLADRPRRQRMGRAGRDWVLRWLDDRRLLGRYEAILRRAIGDGAARGRRAAASW